MKMNKWFFAAVAVVAAIALAGCPNGNGNDNNGNDQAPVFPDPTLGLPFNPGPVNPHAVWTMTQDTVIQALDGVIEFPSPVPPQLFGQWLQRSGAPAAETSALTDAARVVNSTFLRITGRGENWHTFDIRTTAQENLANFEADVSHVITVWGYAPQGTTVSFSRADDPWSGFGGSTLEQEGGVFMLRRTFTWAEITESGQNRIRIAVPLPPPEFEIFNINVVPVVAQDPGNGNGNGADWQAVIASDYIDTRNATLAATADGISVTGRGTGEHDHNNGLRIDIEGLRALAGGTPEIVISGTAGADSGRMEIQGIVGGAGDTFTGGTFSITISGGSVVDVPGWLGGTTPVIGTAPNTHFDYTVTGITVGGTCIKELLAD